MKVKAIFDYKSDYDEDLSFDAGTIINIISVENDEWYSGEYDGKQGMFPKNFVEELKNQLLLIQVGTLINRQFLKNRNQHSL